MVRSARTTRSKSRITSRAKSRFASKSATRASSWQLRPAKKSNRRQAKKITNRFKQTRPARQQGGAAALVKISLGVISAVLAIVFVGYQFFLPHYLFELSQPQNLLVVPTNLESEDDILLFAHVDAEERRRSFHVIDGSAEVEVVGGYGRYQLQNVYPLLKMEQKDQQFITAAFNHALTMALDRVLVVDRLTADLLDNGELKQVLLSYALSERSLDYLRLHYLLKDQPRNSLAVLGAADFSKLVPNYQTITDQQARNCPVAVINTTRTNGLAGSISKIIEDNGGLVVRITSENTVRPISGLLLGERAESQCQEVIQLVRGLFPFGLEEAAASSQETSQYRSQLILFAGEDVAGTFGGGQL